MSTRINVNVDQAALLQRSREQTQANRWAFLEGQNRSKVGKEAERQRDANRAARGLTADGSMYNNRLRQLPQRPDPAAWRVNIRAFISHAWSETFSEAGPTTTGLIGDNTSYGATYQTGDLLQSRVRSGDGASLSSLTNLFGFREPALPTNGYTWEPTYGAFYDNFALSWGVFALGPRTYRSISLRQDNNIEATLVLPAGRGTSVVMLFRYIVKWCTDVTRVHQLQSAPGAIAGNSQNVPTLSQLQSYFQANHASKLVPGGSVPVAGSGGGLAGTYPKVVWYAGGSSSGTIYENYDVRFNLSTLPGTLYPGSPNWNVLEHVSRDCNIYFCTQQSIKQITPSATLQNFIDYWNPPQSGRSPLGSTGQTVPNSFTRLRLLRDLNTGDPLVFQNLNGYYQFTDPANILDSATIKYRIDPDTRVGAYSLPSGSNNFEIGSPYFYARAKVADPYGQLGQRAAKVDLNPARPPAMDPSLLTTWDWDRPDYCRARLLDMGFTEADLTP